MNQILPLGKGVLIALDHEMPRDEIEMMSRRWHDVMPDVPMAMIPGRVVDLGGINMFEFTGDVSPTMVAEFQLWWKEVNGGN